ncbi:MAG: hypothetical protein O7C75_05745 [Verrucomicrobia bacterium]|nr:hypothetical protein [Verrucomicrobiota bacterium]
MLSILTVSVVSGLAQKSRNLTSADPELTNLEDFIVYAEPRVIDALRKRPFSQRDPVVELFFQQLPGISNQIYENNLRAMQTYLIRCEEDQHRKIQRLSELAGLDKPPADLVEGYEERISNLKLLLKWLQKKKPIELTQIDVWRESELRYRLDRMPVNDIRINPETEELESRLRFQWKMIYQNRPRAKDWELNFDIGIHLQEQTGYYDPKGFMHWSKFDTKNLNRIEFTYPIIITDALRENPQAEMPAHIAAYQTTVNSFYQILREVFFSDLADLHTLYILTRGRIFANEWNQYQTTALQRGLAAYLAFQTLEEQIGKSKAREILDNDWTTWHIRKIGSEFNSITWEYEQEPFAQYLAYKNKPDLRNIYWSTKFVHYLVDRYGSTFVPNYCGSLRALGREKRISLKEADLFNRITGDDLNAVIKLFIDENSSI